MALVPIPPESIRENLECFGLSQLVPAFLKERQGFFERIPALPRIGIVQHTDGNPGAGFSKLVTMLSAESGLLLEVRQGVCIPVLGMANLSDDTQRVSRRSPVADG